MHRCAEVVICHFPAGGRRGVLVAGDAKVDANL